MLLFLWNQCSEVEIVLARDSESFEPIENVGDCKADLLHSEFALVCIAIHTALVMSCQHLFHKLIVLHFGFQINQIIDSVSNGEAINTRFWQLSIYD